MSSRSWIYKYIQSFSCEHYTELVSQSLDRPLSLSEKISYRFHHLICMVCRRYNRQLKLINKASQKLEQTEGEDGLVAPEELSPEAKRRLLEVVKGDHQG